MKGFSPDALAFIRLDICSYRAEAGLSHKPFPLSRHVLLSPDILTTAAFAHGKDRESVPAYRDGEAGKELQMNMVKIVLKRLKEHSVRGRQDVFSNGPQWVAFARLSPFVTSVLTTEFGAEPKTWPDPAAAFHAQMWSGEYDVDICKISSQIPEHYDGRCAEMTKLLKNLFTPLSKLLKKIEADEAMKEVPQDPPPPAQDKPEGKESEVSTESLPDTGDITEALAKDLDLVQKKKLVNDLNRQEKQRRDNDIQQALAEQAAQVLRNRLMIFRTVTDAKNWMESSRPGFVARSIIVDVGMSTKHQVSAKTRQTCKVITPPEAKQWSEAIKMIPTTPIIGNVSIRPCQQGSIQKLHEHLEDTHKHLPISVPHSYWRRLRSAASRRTESAPVAVPLREDCTCLHFPIVRS